MTRTPEERAAMEWLDQFAATAGWRHQVKVIKRLLGAPRLPDVNDHAAIDGLVNALWAKGYQFSRVDLVELFRIMHEPPKPATKTVQVWHVEAFRHQDDMPSLSLHTSKEGADKMAWCLEHEQPKPRHFSCIRVTGPHTHEVPA